MHASCVVYTSYYNMSQMSREPVGRVHVSSHSCLQPNFWSDMESIRTRHWYWGRIIIFRIRSLLPAHICLRTLTLRCVFNILLHFGKLCILTISPGFVYTTALTDRWSLTCSQTKVFLLAVKAECVESLWAIERQTAQMHSCIDIYKPPSDCRNSLSSRTNSRLIPKHLLNAKRSERKPKPYKRRRRKGGISCYLRDDATLNY
jgi:hypothetical protein